MPGTSLPAPLAALLSIDLPDPVKAVAGLALQTAEDVRQLPGKLTGLPMTVVSTLMQRSMNLQQQYAELVTKGEEFISTMRVAPSDQPQWATFDEDDSLDSGPTPITVLSEETPVTTAGPIKPTASAAKPPIGKRPRSSPTATLIQPSPGIGPGSSFDQIADSAPTPVRAARTVRPTDPAAPQPPVARFDQLTIPQLRARLRSFDADTVAALIEYEAAAGARPPVLVMLRSRLATLRPKE